MDDEEMTDQDRTAIAMQNCLVWGVIIGLVALMWGGVVWILNFMFGWW